MKHGLSRHPLFNTYRNMVRRCTVPTFDSYEWYGGRGIQVEWKSAAEFIRDMEESYKPGLQIDRIDSNGNYCKSNCRWATPKQQANNLRNNVRLTYRNETKTVGEWAELLGVPYETLKSRYKRGYSDEEILQMPLHAHRPKNLKSEPSERLKTISLPFRTAIRTVGSYTRTAEVRISLGNILILSGHRI